MNLFAIDSLKKSALQLAISSQIRKTKVSNHKGHEGTPRKNLTADDTDNTDLHGSEELYRGLTRMCADQAREIERSEIILHFTRVCGCAGPDRSAPAPHPSKRKARLPGTPLRRSLTMTSCGAPIGSGAQLLNLEKGRLSDMSYWIVDGQQLTNEQYEELQRQKLLEKQRIQEEAARLSRQLGEAYAALKNHLERNPNASHKITGERALEQQIYYNLRRNLGRANEAPRCMWLREDGTVCKSPKMKDDIHCYAHYQMRKARAENLFLPALTDANAIQMAVMLVQRALLDDEISEKKAGLMLYSIQIAAANVDKTTFGQSDAEMVTEIQPEEVAMDAHEERMEKLKKIEKVKTLPLISTEDTDLKEEQNLPRMDADPRRAGTGERGSEKEDLPLINTEDTDLNGGIGKMLPQPVSQLEGFAS